jgi:regulator of sigma E protease
VFDLSLVYILMVVAMLGFLILAHEFGHFIFAKLAGVAVPEFAIGFGPGFRIFKWNETSFSLRAFPLGGFVRLKGLEESYLEGGEETDSPPAEEPLASPPSPTPADFQGNFRYKPAPWRLLILLGGILFNTFLAYLLFASNAFITGKTESVPVITDVLPDMPAQQAGLLPGDILRSLDGQVLPLSEVVRRIAESGGKSITLVVERSRESFSIPVSPTHKDPKDPASRFVIGAVFMDAPVAYSLVESVFPDSPAAKAGLKAGDEVLTVEGISPTAFFALLNAEYKSDGVLNLTVRRATETFSLGIPFTGGSDIGFVLNTRRVPISAGDAFVFANRQMSAIVRGFFGFFGDLLRRRKTDGRLTGPIGIIQIGTRAARQGLPNFFYLMAYISLVLAIVNLLPIPALDGGHILFLLLEQALRRKINPRLQTMFHTIGFVALLLLLVVISFFDVKQIFSR